jgi:hypothetical protein
VVGVGDGELEQAQSRLGPSKRMSVSRTGVAVSRLLTSSAS